MSIHLKDEGAETISRWEGSSGKAHVAGYVWDTILLDWVRMTQPGGGGGGAGDASAANQLLELAELQEINRKDIIQIDEASSTVTYVGYAVPGTADASALWKIRKILVVGSVTSIKYADGNENYDNVWNNRASLTYT